MRVPKFKVGDKVKVLRASIEDEYDLWMDAWMPEMNKSIGHVFTIKYVYDCSSFEKNCKYSKYSLSNHDGMSYPEFVLQDTTIGKQLMFSFMNKE